LVVERAENYMHLKLELALRARIHGFISVHEIPPN